MQTMEVDSTRARQARWDAAHLQTACTRIPRNQYMRFKTLCLIEGTTPYAVIKAAVENWVENHEQSFK